VAAAQSIPEATRNHNRLTARSSAELKVTVMPSLLHKMQERDLSLFFTRKEAHISGDGLN
jgi:hypothetical protein